MLNILGSDLNWRIGFEIELMAPVGLTREDLAIAIAESRGGTVERYFHLQSEFSKVPDTPIFDNLTLAFKVVDYQGQWIASFVDDITLQDDLEKSKQPKPGWYRIVSDDARFLELICHQTNAGNCLSQVLDPIADLFGTKVLNNSANMFRVVDAMGRSIAIAAPLPGERERPCELITAPIDQQHLKTLQSLLDVASCLGFTAPIEGAIHLHFDAKPLYSAGVFANLVNLLWTHGRNLRELVGTNKNCRRLADWSEELVKTVNTPDFRLLPWPEAKACLAKISLTKYCDFNVKNIVYQTPNKETFEVRIFPVWLESKPIIQAAKLMEAILNYVITTDVICFSPPSQLEETRSFLDQLPGVDVT